MSSSQHEAYVLPTPRQRDTTTSTTSGAITSSQTQPQSQSNVSAYAIYASGYAAGDDSQGPVTQYICGECSNKVRLRKGDVIRCTACGHRVLYKERTKRMVQFEAR